LTTSNPCLSTQIPAYVANIKDANTGIEVTVKPYGSQDCYAEWKAPNFPSELRPNDRDDCYIEAVAGERFALQVVVPAGFD